MDTHNNRPFRFNVKSKITALRLKKYNEAKAELAKYPSHKGSVPIPKINREEIVGIMIEAWEELDPQLGANALVVVKLIPYEVARSVGWTPKDAFADIHH